VVEEEAFAMNKKKFIKRCVRKFFNFFGLHISTLKDELARRDKNMSNFLDQVAGAGFYPHTVIDIGVAYGTPELYEKFPQACHLLVEPLREWEDSLKGICKKYNAEYVLAAAGPSAGTMVINVRTTVSDSTSYKVLSGVGESVEAREVPVVAIDDLCLQKKLKPPYVIKVDVQGGELEVLKGAGKVLEETELVILEASFFHVYENGPEILDVLKFMKDSGFVLYDVFDFNYRLSDRAVVQANFAFVKERGVFRKSLLWLESHENKNLAIEFAMSVNPALIGMAETKVFAGPGLNGHKAAIYNPGTVIDNNNIIALANYRECSWEQALSSDRCFDCRNIMSLTLDGNLEPKNFELLPIDGYDLKGLTRIEDFRVFKFKDKIYINYNSISKPHANSPHKERRDVQVISEFDIKNKKIIFLGSPKVDFAINKNEKNWAYFEHDGDLYLLYSFAPYRLLKLSDLQGLKFKTLIFDDSLKIEIPRIDKAFKLFLSTNPVKYDENHFLVVFHTKINPWPANIYSHWVALIDKKSLLPVSICVRPILSGAGIRGEYKNVVYVMSTLIIGNDVVFFLGEGDTYSSYVKINKEKLSSFFIPIARR